MTSIPMPEERRLARAKDVLVGVNAALGQQNFRRPPARRFLIRR